jgi:hypothetical protein
MWTSKYTRHLETELARLRAELEKVRSEGPALLEAQSVRLCAESATLHERDKAEIARLLGDLVSLQGRYQLLEMSILSTTSPAGAQFAHRNDPEANQPAPAVQSDQGSNWDRVRRRMIAEDNENWERMQKARREKQEAGQVPTPAPFTPGEVPLPSNDLRAH